MASGELLKQIQAGKKLKKAETNDRSAPVIEIKSGGGSVVGTPSVAKSSSSPAAAPSLGAGGPPQLGNLFAGGVPKLKSAGQGGPAKPPTLGKPPAIPKRDNARPPTAPPAAPPHRPAPALPSRSPGSVSNRPTLPPRATPSPPPSAPGSGRSPSPATITTSPARAVPTVFWKFSSGACPPSEKAASGQPCHEAEPPAPAPPGPSPARASLAQPLISVPHRPRVASGPAKSEPRSSVHVPSPPPTAGGHTFPVNNFPPPPPFVPSKKSYGGGRQHGSDFDPSNLE
ncbi:hypothetical protein EDD16DRAFT_1581448 [Pisolithus croceorrhizus]|nr:hypothetical protein EDD16DRAFT_1581448 [Pisolithus croceorrhizus]